MTFANGSNLYAQGFGSVSSNSFPGNAIRATRAPSSADIKGPQGNYTLGQLWLDTVAQKSYQLSALSSSASSVTATWIVLGGDSYATSYTTDSGTAIPSAGVLAVVGGSGISTSGSGNTITVAATGGSSFTTIHMQVFTSSGTYTPTANMQWCIVECVGGGGAGGGVDATDATDQCVSAGGGAGEYARGLFSAGTVGASQTVTIGAGGLGVPVTGGNPGGTTSFGSLMTANGGGGGGTTDPGPNTSSAVAGTGGTGGTGGSFRCQGSNGKSGIYISYSVLGSRTIIPGTGGSSFFGGASGEIINDNGIHGKLYGGGGGGTGSNGFGPFSGGNGADGICVITEFIS